MLGFDKWRHWSWAKVPRLESWSLDRNWHRAEAERHLKARDWAEAERHLRFAVDEADQRNSNPAQRVRLKLELADVQRRLAQPGETSGALDKKRLLQAERTVREAIVIAAGVSDGAGYVNGLDVLGDIFRDSERWAELERVCEESIRLGAALPHPDPLRMAKRVHRLGVARHHNGHTQEAGPALEKAILLHEQSYGIAGAETGDLLTEVGKIYRAQGEHAKAQECLKRALRIHEAVHGNESPQAFQDLQQLAGSLEESGDLDGASAQYERALMMKLRKLGVGNLSEVAEMQYSLANLHIGWGNLSRARELLSECIGAFRREGGARLAVAYEMLAQVEERSGRYHCAVKELEQAGKAWEKCGQERVQEQVRNLTYRADLLEQLRKTREAEWLRKQAADLDPQQSSEEPQAQSAAS